MCRSFSCLQKYKYKKLFFILNQDKCLHYAVDENFSMNNNSIRCLL